jgi:hypothetical protein
MVSKRWIRPNESMTEAPEDRLESSRSRTAPFVALVVVMMVVAGGGIGQLSGTGWFGHRAWLYGQGELYLLNLSSKTLHASVDGRERVEVTAENAAIAELVGGTSEVVIFEEGKEIARHAVTARNSHALLKLTDDGCLVVTDIGGFYGGKSDALSIVEKLPGPTRGWTAGSTNVVWPRKTFPKRLSAEGGKGLWVELVACELLEDDKFLDAYLTIRLEERMKKALGKDQPPPRRRL